MASEEVNGLRFYNSGDFTITGVLSGDCGSAQVFLVEDETGEKYALKVLNRKAVRGSDDAQKLYEIVRNEAEELRVLEHGAFPRVYGTYSHKDERGLVEKGLVMEYIPGETLEDKIKNGVNVEESLRYFEEAVVALDYLHHANGLSKAHRDVKPENIIIDEEGRLRILDLGSVTDKVGRTFGTTLKTFQGTVKYAHTEQITGNASPATDLYSLGLVLYELVCGEIKNSEFGKTHEAVDYDEFRSKIGGERAEIVTETLRGMLELKYKSGTELMRDYRRERVVVQERSNNTWNIPDIEPRKFVNDILHSDENIGLMQSSLKEYLSRNERLIGEEEKQRIKKIIDRLEKKENPISMAIEQFRTFPKERIFGSSREDIWGLERLVFNENGNYEGKLKDDEDFRGLVEKAYEKGINVNDLEELKFINNMILNLVKKKITNVGFFIKKDKRNEFDDIKILDIFKEIIDINKNFIDFNIKLGLNINVRYDNGYLYLNKRLDKSDYLKSIIDLVDYYNIGYIENVFIENDFDMYNLLFEKIGYKCLISDKNCFLIKSKFISKLEIEEMRKKYVNLILDVNDFLFDTNFAVGFNIPMIKINSDRNNTYDSLKKIKKEIKMHINSTKI